jgi:hypothetical protein
MAYASCIDPLRLEGTPSWSKAFYTTACEGTCEHDGQKRSTAEIAKKIRRGRKEISGKDLHFDLCGFSLRPYVITNFP